MLYRIEAGLFPHLDDTIGRKTAASIREALGIPVKSVRTIKVFTLEGLDAQQVNTLMAKSVLHDPVLQAVSLSPLPLPEEGTSWIIEVGYRPGVTDNEGRTARDTAALVLGILYCTVRDYHPYMATICAGVYLFKLVDGIADVYEGRLQQADKLYLAGISQTLRSGAVFLIFTLFLLVTHNIAVASVAMGVAAVASLVLVTIPLALLETEKSRRWRLEEVTDLFRQCFPLFAALFLFNLIETMPKLVMEGSLPYENQIYFNALYFPSQSIQIIIGFIYKPQLVRLANIWSNPRKRRRFDLIILAMVAVIVGVTAAVGILMATVGIPFTSFMYGVDFEQFRFLCYLMVIAGGVIAAIDFLYAIVTVLRRQGSVMRLYLLAFVAVTALSLVLVNLIGLTGAVASYLASMAFLLVLLILEYLNIRRAIRKERNPFSS